MPATVSMEVPVDREPLVRRLLALAEELDQLAATASEGTVFAACEEAVLVKGRDVQRALLEQAVQRRIDAAEKKGPRSVSAPAGGSRRTAARSPAPC